MARSKAFDQDEALEQAMCLFWERGFEATSIQDLVDHLGVKRQSLYDTFGDKKRLYLQCLEAYRLEGLKPLALLDGDGPVLGRFQALFRSIIDDALADPHNRGCFMGNATLEMSTRDDEVAAIVLTNIEGYEQAFTRVLVEAQQKGELKPDRDPVALSRYFFNSIQGLRVTAKATRDRARLDDIAAVTLAVLAPQERP